MRRFTLATILALLFVPFSMVKAENLLDKNLTCSNYEDPESYVKALVLSCLQSRSALHCDKEAKKRFKKCNYEASYDKLSREVSKDLFIAVVLSRGSAVLKSSYNPPLGSSNL